VRARFFPDGLVPELLVRIGFIVLITDLWSIDLQIHRYSTNFVQRKNRQKDILTGHQKLLTFQPAIHRGYNEDFVTEPMSMSVLKYSWSANYYRTNNITCSQDLANSRKVHGQKHNVRNLFIILLSHCLQSPKTSLTLKKAN